VHPLLAFDHEGSETAQNVEREVGLDLAVMEFDLPAAGVEFGDGRVGKSLFIEQRGDDDYTLSAESAGWHLKADQP
jgi:hypothetical protein